MSEVSPIEAEVIRIRTLLQQNQFPAALAATEALAAEVPENRDVLYMMAVAQRNLQRIPEALQTLERLERLHPTYSRLFQERGHCYVGLRQAQPAIDAFLHAVNINPALPASWSLLNGLYKMTGQAANAAMAAAHVTKLGELPPEVVTATSMFSDGEVYPAEQMIRAYLLSHGDHVEAMRLLAKIGMQLEVLDDAELLLENILRLQPKYHAARHDYALVLLQRHKHERALEELETLLKIEPGHRGYRITYASVLVGLGQHEKAIELYREVLRETPQAADLHLSVAHALKTLGQQQDAIASYRKAIEYRSAYGDAYWSLANLKTYRFTAEEIESMRGQEALPNLALEDRYTLCFALGKALEDQQQYAESFQYYERGNSLK
jgi:tetratricopeptide (TPR) repeat protein